MQLMGTAVNTRREYEYHVVIVDVYHLVACLPLWVVGLHARVANQLRMAGRSRVSLRVNTTRGAFFSL